MPRSKFHSQYRPREKPREDYIGFRPGVELRARAIHAAASMGLSLSDWLRMVVRSAVDGGGLAGIVSDHDSAGFQQGRALGFALVQTQMQELMRGLTDAAPMTFEEFQTRYPEGLPPINQYNRGY